MGQKEEESEGEVEIDEADLEGLKDLDEEERDRVIEKLFDMLEKKGVDTEPYERAIAKYLGIDVDINEGGESELDEEEGEFEWEEGESELEFEGESVEASQSESEEQDDAPQLVPIEDNEYQFEKAPQVKVSKHKKPVIPDFPSEQDSSDNEASFDSSELEELEAQYEAEMGNPHGFVYAHTLNTYKMNKAEKLEAKAGEEKVDPREKRKMHQKRRDKKENKTGTTNKQKQDNKPMSMMLPKKVLSRNETRDAKKIKIHKNAIK